MKLNIYTISHPIIQILSNTVRNARSQPNTKNQAYKQLGTFLIYEIIRNWLKIYKLNIKQINSIRKFIVIDPKESYIIMTDIDINLALIQEASWILPNCSISLIDFRKSNNEYLIDSNFSYIPRKISQSTKIIIFHKHLNHEYLFKLMNYFITIKQIDIEQIRLTCITCQENELVKISQKYPKLKVYTTELTNDLYNYLKKF